MATLNHLTVGTRGSKLALIQTQLVADALKSHNPELIIETKTITTKGDTNQSPIPLDTVGKNWFTAEIEQALLSGEIDIAIHSLKDVSPDPERGLATIPVLQRADPRDVLISRSGVMLKDLPQGATVGTDSARRKVLLLDQRPDLIVKSIRGNVDTRIKKLHAEDGGAENYDAIVIAAAGLERLGMLDMVTEFFDPTVFLIAPGQGILAAQTREGETEIVEMLRGLGHAPTSIAAEAELAFSRAIGGGCKLPVGCYAKLEHDRVTMYGMIGGEDGKQIKRTTAEGPAGEVVAFAKKMAGELL